ncbi:MAG: phenylpyruvate tautomerase [Methylophagaceae bacterium]|jgi:phenylpyruvate tautomerase
MPYLNIVTNQVIDDEVALLKEASRVVSEATGKQETYVMVSTDYNPHMLMGGSSSPLAFLDYRALGLPAERSTFADVLCQLVSDQTSIPGDRIYISMTDSERQNWGWNHQTF